MIEALLQKESQDAADNASQLEQARPAHTPHTHSRTDAHVCFAPQMAASLENQRLELKAHAHTQIPIHTDRTHSGTESS